MVRPLFIHYLWRFFLIGFIFSLNISCDNDKIEKITEITYVQNNVEIIDRSKSIRKAEIKGSLNEGDTIKTGINSSVTFQIKDVGVLRVLPYSDVMIAAIKKKDTTGIILKNGSIYSYILPGSSDYIIKTPNAEIQTLGTRFLVTHENEETTVPVQEGAVKIYAAGNKRDWAAVRERNSASVTPDSKIEIIPISELHEIKLQKLGLHPYINNVEKITPDELNSMFSGISKVERHMDMITEDILVMLRNDMLLREKDIQKERGEILKEEIALQLKIAMNEQRLVQQQREFYKNRETANEKEKKALLAIAEREKDLEGKKQEIQKERTKYQGDIKTYEEQIAKLEKEIQSEKERMSGEKLNVEKEKELIQSERDKILKDIEAVQKEKENAQIERDALKAERDKILKDIESVQKEKELAVQTDQKEEQEKLAGLEEKYKKDLASLDEQNRAKVTGLEKEYQDKIAALEKQLQEKELEKKGLETAKNSDQETANARLSEQQKELEKKREELELEKKRFEESKKTEMEKETARIRDEQKELERKRRDLEEAKKKKEDTNEFPPLAKLKEQGKQIVAIKLKDGSVIKGAVDSQTERLLKLDVGDGIINIPIQEIVSRNAEK